MSTTKNKYHGTAHWVGLLGNDDGDVILSVNVPDTEVDHEFLLEPGTCRWLYEQLKAFCG